MSPPLSKSTYSVPTVDSLPCRFSISHHSTEEDRSLYEGTQKNPSGEDTLTKEDPGGSNNCTGRQERRLSQLSSISKASTRSLSDDRRSYTSAQLERAVSETLHSSERLPSCTNLESQALPPSEDMDKGDGSSPQGRTNRRFSGISQVSRLSMEDSASNYDSVELEEQIRRSLMMREHSLRRDSFQQLSNSSRHLAPQMFRDNSVMSLGALDVESIGSPGSERGSSHHDGTIMEEYNLLAKTTAVNRVKVIVLLMLVCAAVLVTFLVWWFAKSDEVEDFDVQFETFAQQVTESFMHNMDMKIMSAYTLSSVFTSRYGPDGQERHHGNKWPNITMIDFDKQCKGAMVATHSNNIFFAPLLNNDTVDPWLQYASDAYSTNFHASLHPGGEDMLTEEFGMYKVDENGILITHHDGPHFVPMWQTTQGNPDGFLFDYYAGPVCREAIDEMIQFKTTEVTAYVNQDAHYYYKEDDDTPPSALIFSPIFDDFTADQEVVGIIGIDFNFLSVFANVLPAHVVGITIVLACSDGREHTFVLNGMVPEYKGAGDLHDKQFDNMEVLFTYHTPNLDNEHFYHTNHEGHHEGHHPNRQRRQRQRQRQLQLDNRYGLPEQLLESNPNLNMQQILEESEFYQQDDNHRFSQRSLKETNLFAPRSDESGNHEWGEYDGEQNHHDDIRHKRSRYVIRVYPSESFQNNYETRRPAVIATIVAFIFFFTSMTFIIYDCLAEKRNSVIMNRAVQNSKIVHSLFPETVRERILMTESNREEQVRGRGRGKGKRKGAVEAPTVRLKNFLQAPSGNHGEARSNTIANTEGDPIADMFPETTILFADIAGFTAWASEREPSQVFIFLENIYREFDIEAKKLNIFKIETIGDCYVAATGLPDPREDHAIVMARFALQCLIKFQEVCKELEVSLGPGTASLGIRIGMHSGAVTAGVLRGEKSRFQLFGDTMNTASRMESSGKKNLVQVSPETAKLLRDGGKPHWLLAREEIVVAKGKGEIQTYWLRPRLLRPPSNTRSQTSIASSLCYANAGWDTESDDAKRTNRRVSIALQPRNAIHSQEDDIRRMVKWNAAVLEKLLLNVVTHRQSTAPKNIGYLRQFSIHNSDESSFRPKPARRFSEMSDSLLNEISDAVKFEPYEPRVARKSIRTSTCVTSIGPEAKEELMSYVSRIASTYRQVHFHNFEHASHVTMSANKLMKKVCARNWGSSRNTEDAVPKKKRDRDREGQVQAFFRTFGISSDPLAQFAVVFAALVHDADHLGVPNDQVIKEKPSFAAKYENKSVAEQNSICVAWEILMEPEYRNLRNCIFCTDDEKKRFKQLLIHMIIATDIADRVRMQKEKRRWKKAFDTIGEWDTEWEGKSDEELARIDVSFRATVVLEQLMLASDISHTMQHWITYSKWNERLFKERMTAYIEDRAEADPREGWYESEIGFFDFYIIPLAKRLKDCGVFGSAGDEYLGYALKNREEWTEKGQEITASYAKWGEKQMEKSSKEIESD